jgi:Ca2+-binding RTX toxin-like protein
VRPDATTTLTRSGYVQKRENSTLHYQMLTSLSFYLQGNDLIDGGDGNDVLHGQRGDDGR